MLPFTALGIADIGEKILDRERVKHLPGFIAHRVPNKQTMGEAEAAPAVSKFTMPARFFPHSTLLEGMETGYPDRYHAQAGDIDSPIAQSLLANPWDTYEGSVKDVTPLPGMALVDRVPFKF